MGDKGSKLEVFLSYASKDRFLAELADLKLTQAGFHVWRDQGQLRTGSDWRKAIDVGISRCDVLVVALSRDSNTSPYVTYEWAFAAGKGKPIVPLKLEPCDVHPRLEAIQYLDFSVPTAAPWELLIAELNELEIPENSTTEAKPTPSESTQSTSPLAASVLRYLTQRGFTMVSYERIKKNIDPTATDDSLDDMIDKHRHLFRAGVLKGGRRGVALVNA